MAYFVVLVNEIQALDQKAFLIIEDQDCNMML